MAYLMMNIDVITSLLVSTVVINLFYVRIILFKEFFPTRTVPYEDNTTNPNLRNRQKQNFTNVSPWNCVDRSRLKFARISHPSQRPDLATCYVHFFSHLKGDLKGKYFSMGDKVKSAMASRIKERPREFFVNGMRKLVSH